MKLSKRLKTVFNMIKHGQDVVDVGSDHGHLLIELAKTNNYGKLLGVENKIAPYNRLKQNLILNQVFDKVEIALSDGLQNVNDNYSTVVLAGMGYEIIKNILLDSLKKLDGVEYIIVDSHTKVWEVRELITNLGYYIDEEKCLFEKDIFYEIIRFKKGKKDYTLNDLQFGPILLKEKSEDFIKYYEEELKKYRNILQNNLPDDAKNKVLSKIKQIEEIL